MLIKSNISNIMRKMHF